MKNEMICAAMAQPKQNKAQKMFGNVLGFGTAMSAVVGTAATTTFADAFAEASFDVNKTADADSMMKKVIGILLGICKYVGVALIVYGIYEVVMSFMQNQPEAKTKGIIMALCGAVMMTIQSILTSVMGGGGSGE